MICAVYLTDKNKPYCCRRNQSSDAEALFSMENGAAILKLEHLVKEIISAANIPFCKIESAVDYNVQAGEEELLPLIHIVSYFDEARNSISQLLAAEFDLTEITIATANPAEGFAGVKQRFVATLKANRASLSEYRKWAGAKFEIQLGTVLSAALSGMVYSLGLDAATLPNETKRDLFRIEALLETAEKELSKIRQHYGSSEPAAKPGKPMAAPMQVEVVAPRRQGNPEAEAPKAAPVPKAEAAPVIAPKQEPVKAAESTPAPPPPAPPQAQEPAAKYGPQVNGSSNGVHRTQAGNVISSTPVSENNNSVDPGYIPMSHLGSSMTEADVPISYAALREFVRNSRLLKEVDSQIAAHAGARLNDDIDIEGDVERLQFLQVFTLKQLHETILENKADMVSFAEKWIGKDNGGTFDSGIGLFYLEYVLVAKSNDPTFATDYVLRYISDNDYSARYIIPTYNSLKVAEKQGSYSAVKK